MLQKKKFAFIGIRTWDLRCESPKLDRCSKGRREGDLLRKFLKECVDKRENIVDQDVQF